MLIHHLPEGRIVIFEKAWKASWHANNIPKRKLRRELSDLSVDSNAKLNELTKSFLFLCKMMNVRLDVLLHS